MTRAIDSVPDGWRMVQLDAIANVVGGSTPSRGTKEFWDGSISWVVPSELTGLPNRYLSCTKETITSAGLKAAGLRTIPINSVLLTTRATIGVMAINTIPVTTNQGFQSVVVKPGTDFLWLYYCLTAMRQELQNRASGSTFQEVSRDSVRSLPILLPPLREQHRIAKVLDAIDKSIESTCSVILNIGQLRDALLHQLLTRGITGKNAKWQEAGSLGSCPADWDIVKLSELVVLDQPGTWGGEPTRDDPGVRVLRAADLTTDGKIDISGVVTRQVPNSDRVRRLLQDGDLVLERSGGGPGRPVGRVAIISDLGELYCSNFCQQLRVDQTRSRPRYVYWALWHRYLRGVTRRLEHRTTGIRNLDYAGYLAFPVALPSLAEQDAIADILDSVDETLIQTQDQLLKHLETLKLSASDALLLGRVRTGV